MPSEVVSVGTEELVVVSEVTVAPGMRAVMPSRSISPIQTSVPSCRIATPFLHWSASRLRGRWSRNSVLLRSSGSHSCRRWFPRHRTRQHLLDQLVDRSPCTLLWIRSRPPGSPRTGCSCPIGRRGR
eukprot:7378243-Prymnesium_polylepis.1